MRFRFGRSRRDTLESYAKRLEEKAHELTKELQKKNAELKRIQGLLVQSAKMTAIGELSAGVAHELNNPLGGILGYAQFAIEKLGSAKPSESDFKAMAKYIEHIEREAARCKGIVENLLIFARKSNEIRSVDIKEVLNDTLAIMNHQLKLSNVNLAIDMPKNTVKLRGNAAQLQQAFINIILNAQQAMPNGGDLAISVRQTDDKFEMSFEDTGCGIPQENLDKIFEPFFTTKECSNGTGLGLTVSSLIIKEHKGKISVKSVVNKGTAFSVTLPVPKGEG